MPPSRSANTARRLACAIVFAVLAQLAFDFVLGVVLQIRVERGAHHEKAVGNGFRESVDELAHLVEGEVEVIVRRVFRGAVDRRRRIAPRAINLALGHESVIDQVVEDDIGARAGGGKIDERREFGRCLEQAGEHRRFRQRHVAHRFAEVVLGRGVHAKCAAAEIGAIEIKLENLLLAQVRFQPERKKCLVDLALIGTLVGQKQVLRELLGDGRPALNHAAGLGIGHKGAEGALEIDAEVLEETPVLGCEHRLDQVIGKLVERHRVVMLDAAAADFIAVAVEKRHREIGLFQPVAVGRLAEGRHAERHHEKQAACAQRRHFRQRLDEEPAPPAGHVSAVHDGGETLVDLAGPFAGLEHRRIDPGVEIEQQPFEFWPPVVAWIGKHVRHCRVLRETA